MSLEEDIEEWTGKTYAETQALTAKTGADLCNVNWSSAPVTQAGYGNNNSNSNSNRRGKISLRMETSKRSLRRDRGTNQIITDQCVEHQIYAHY